MTELPQIKCQRTQFNTLMSHFCGPICKYAQEQEGSYTSELPDLYLEEVIIFLNEEI